MSSSVSIQNFTRHAVPRLPFDRVTAEVLPGWEISLVFVGEKRARQLNTALRNKSYVPNVLSYRVGPKSGEIIICPVVAKRQAPQYSLRPAPYTLYLFIHGLLHIKGRVHGGTMERSEQKLLAKFL